MKEFILTGGPTGMTFILFLGFAIVIVSLAEISRRLSKAPFSKIDNKLLLTISSLGGFAILFGMFYQILGLYQAYQAIMIADDISPMIVMGGVFVSFYAPLFGLGVGLVAFGFWYAIKVIWYPGKGANAG
jgi:hypothetical protein